MMDDEINEDENLTNIEFHLISRLLLKLKKKSSCIISITSGSVKSPSFEHTTNSNLKLL